MIKKKTNGVFICLSENRLHAAVTSGAVPSCKIDKVFQARWDDESEIESLKGELESHKNGNYIPSRFAFSPSSRFVRKFEIDKAAKKKNANYLLDIIRDEFRLEPEKLAVNIVNQGDGEEFDVDEGTETKVVFSGLETEELREQQNKILENGFYPESLEISSVAVLGGIVDYSRQMEIPGAILILDITSDNSQVFVIRQGEVDVTRPIPYGVHSMIPVVKQELGLKDDESARKLFFSNTFDFTEVGPKLLKKLIRELQASTGFYEVQTGQTISQIYLPMLPDSLRWIIPVLAEALGVEVLNPNFERWLETHGISFDSSIDTPLMNEDWFGLFSLICPHTSQPDKKPDDEKETEESS
ncbi:MAG: hypothetical protein MK080_02160 [Opitutales bacterium]|nr:hypothetical protein [Opitutales bacterium]NRA25638.1 hypothetical protein [Opitutales bacterium]